MSNEADRYRTPDEYRKELCEALRLLWEHPESCLNIGPDTDAINGYIILLEEELLRVS